MTIKKIRPVDNETLEEWVRVAEDEILSAGCSRFEDDDWPWRIHVSVMEFIRSDPLQTILADAISTELRRVPGVRDAQRDDREAWVVAGTPTGSDLLHAVAAAVDRFAHEARIAFDELSGAEARAPARRPWWRFW